MLVKVCNQIVQAVPLTSKTASMHEKKIVPVDNESMRYLRFRAIGNMEVDGANGNWDAFPVEDFEDEEPGYGYKSFIGKRAHAEHNCLLPGTLVLMKDFSYKPIECVVVGDVVYTHEGIFNEVLDVFENPHKGNIFKLKTEGMLTPLFFTGEHPLWVVSKDTKKKALVKMNNCVNNSEGKRLASYQERKSFVSKEIGNPNWVFAKDVSERDYLVMPYIDLERKINIEIDGLDMARFMGYYLAEGSVSGAKNIWGDRLNQVICFSFHKDEVDEIGFIYEFGKKRGLEVTQRFSTSKEKVEAFGEPNCVIVSVFSSEYANLLDLYCGKHAKEKFLSEDVMTMPKEWQIEFLRAYFIGDAYINAKNGIKGSTASKILALQIQEMCLLLGIWCNVAAYRQHTPNDSWVKNSYGNPIYVYSLTTHEAKNIFGDSFKFEEKAKNCAVFKTDYGFLVPITYKEVLPYDGLTYNFEVNEQNSYVVNNIAVHNSSLGLAGSIGDLPDAYLNKFIYPDDVSEKRWSSLLGNKHNEKRSSILSMPNQKDGAIEVLMRIDTNLVKSAQTDKKVRSLLDRIIRMIDTGQKLTCSMGANISESCCSVCFNTARFSSDYCTHLKPGRKGGLTIVSANDIRDALDKELLRPEWLKHLVASKFDVDEILRGSSRKGVAVRNAEINHKTSFFELSVVATPAFFRADQLEKLARLQNEEKKEYLKRIAEEFNDEEVIELYSILQDRGLISNQCGVS